MYKLFDGRRVVLSSRGHDRQKIKIFLNQIQLVDFFLSEIYLKKKLF